MGGSNAKWLGTGLLIAAALVGPANSSAAMKGEPDARAEARAMVESMGGLDLWKEIRSVHFVHDWNVWNRKDAYRENEILDLTGPRSWVEMKSEVYHRLRAYSPEHRYWNVVNGEFSFASEADLAAALERAPYHFCRLAHAIANDEDRLEVRLGTGPFRGSTRIEFFGPDGERHGWIQLNARKEPVVWATTQYEYVFGPMRSFGNLRVPNWASTGNGAVTYDMISLTASRQPPELALFAPPAEHAGSRRN